MYKWYNTKQFWKFVYQSFSGIYFQRISFGRVRYFHKVKFGCEYILQFYDIFLRENSQNNKIPRLCSKSSRNVSCYNLLLLSIQTT